MQDDFYPRVRPKTYNVSNKTQVLKFHRILDDLAIQTTKIWPWNVEYSIFLTLSSIAITLPCLSSCEDMNSALASLHQWWGEVLPHRRGHVVEYRFSKNYQLKGTLCSYSHELQLGWFYSWCYTLPWTTAGKVLLLVLHTPVNYSWGGFTPGATHSSELQLGRFYSWCYTLPWTTVGKVLLLVLHTPVNYSWGGFTPGATHSHELQLGRSYSWCYTLPWTTVGNILLLVLDTPVNYSWEGLTPGATHSSELQLGRFYSWWYTLPWITPGKVLLLVLHTPMNYSWEGLTPGATKLAMTWWVRDFQNTLRHLS
jgi:hypothetical protein